MKGIAIERWPSDFENEVLGWLRETSGYSNPKTWFIDQDYDLVTLVLSEELYLLYKLKWQ